MSSILVTNRINIGYAILTCTIVGLAAMAYLGVSQLGRSYQDYRTTTQQTLLISNLVEDIVEVRTAALKFRTDRLTMRLRP